MDVPQPVEKHLLEGKPGKISAGVEHDLRAVAFHLSNLFSRLKLKREDDLGMNRVAQALVSTLQGRVHPWIILEIAEQEQEIARLVRQSQN